MIVVLIKGGIGNQLFQYALAITLRKEHKSEVYINLDFYSGAMLFVREPINLQNNLQLFQQFQEIQINLISRLNKKLKFSKFKYLVYLLNERLGNYLCEDSQFGFRSVFLKRDLKYVVIDGYFSDYRYIINGLDSVKGAFEKLIKNKNIDYDNFIAMHIRRGDYAAIMRSKNKSNILNILYYKKSLEHLKELYNIDKIRVFTDDYKWAKIELPLIFNNYILDFSPEQFTDVDSLWSISKHEYLICANSTFSLWAYYFGMNDIKQAIFPKEWVNSIEEKGYDLFNREILNIKLVDEE